MKRALDLIGAALALVLLAPVALAVAGIVLFALGRPVLFRQQRPGLGARPFTLLKFRTMTDVRDASGRPAADAARIGPVGAWLRRYSLDEIPQLVNVLRGEMSLVGPRPLLTEYLPLYDARQARRHEVRPGITGWAQIHGRNSVDWAERFELDVWYVDHRSLVLDLRILWLTLRQLVRPRGVNRAGHATMPPFTGNDRAKDAHGRC